MIKIDLHLHSLASDGTLTPTELVKLCSKRNVEMISLTDHDTIDGLEEAEQLAKAYNIEFIRGIELSILYEEVEYHIIGYRLKGIGKDFKDKLNEVCVARRDRAKKIIDKLKQLKIVIDYQKVLELAKGKVVGRPHIAQMMIEEKYVATFDQAFDLYIGRGRPAFVPRKLFGLEEAVSYIKNSGGIPVLAHPGIAKNPSIIRQLSKKGVLGLEVFYSEHSEEQTAHFYNLAKELGLVITGGTDFHRLGEDKKLPGAVEIPSDVIQEFKEALRRV